MSKWFQTRRFLWEFPIGSYVKLSSAVVAILVGGLKCRTEFCKGTTQGSFQQSLVEIGSVVSEEKIFFLISSPFFLFLAWQPSWLEVRITGHNFGRGPSKDHSTKVWSKLAQWFLQRRLKCEKFTTYDGRTDGRRTTDAKWWQKLTLPLARWANKDLMLVFILKSLWL